jgi:small-conductance mechanosensitive channel
MTEEFDALAGFDLLNTLLLVLGILLLGIAIEFGLRYGQRRAETKGWLRTAVVIEAFYWQPIFWCVLIASSQILVGFSEVSQIRQLGQGILRALLLISITIILVRILTGWVRMLTAKKPSASASVVNYLINGVAVLIVILVILNALGVSVTLIAAAILGSTIWLSFVLREPISNLFAGFVLTASQRLTPGDYIRLPSGQEGWVVDIEWDVTLIRIFDESQIIMPNSMMRDAEIINFDRPSSEYLLQMGVGVSYESDLAHVEHVTLDVIDSVLGKFIDEEPADPSFIRFKKFDDYAIEFTAYIRCVGLDYPERLQVQHEFVKQIHARYAEEGIVIPYPIHDVRIRDPGTINGSTKTNSGSSQSVNDLDGDR